MGILKKIFLIMIIPASLACAGGIEYRYINPYTNNFDGTIPTSYLDDTYVNLDSESVNITNGTFDLTTSGTGTFNNLKIEGAIPILTFKDNTDTGDSARGFQEWRDSNNVRLGFFGNSSYTHDDLVWKNESNGGHLLLETTGAGIVSCNTDFTTTGTGTFGDLMIGEVASIDSDGNASFTKVYSTHTITDYLTVNSTSSFGGTGTFDGSILHRITDNASFRIEDSAEGTIFEIKDPDYTTPSISSRTWIPLDDVTYDLGVGGGIPLRWRTLYVGNVSVSTVTFSDGTIMTSSSTFQGYDADLDDLADGTLSASKIEDKFLRNDADDTTNYKITMSSLAVTNQATVGNLSSQDIDASSYNLSITTITFSDFTILTSTSGLGGGGWDGQSDLAIANGVKLTGGYLRIGDGGTVNYASTDGDLFVENKIEVATLFIKSAARFDDDRAFLFGSSADGGFQWNTTGNDHLWFETKVNSANYSGNIIFGQRFDDGTDFGHPISANPRIYIQSSDQTSTGDYISFWHDQTDANIAVGVGDLILTIAGNDLLPSTTNHNLGSSSNYWGTLHIATITYHSIPDYKPDLSVSEDILKIKPSDKSSYPNSIYREPVDTIKIKAIEKDKIPKDKEKIKYKKIKDLPIECLVKKYDAELEDFIEDTMLLDEVTDEEIIEILPQKSEVEVTYVGNEGVSLEAIISLLIEHNKELEQRVRELENLKAKEGGFINPLLALVVVVISGIGFLIKVLLKRREKNGKES